MSMQKLCSLIIITLVASISQSQAWSKVVDIRVTEDFLRKSPEEFKIRSVTRDGIVEFTVIRPLKEGHGTTGWLQVGKDRAKVCACSPRPLCRESPLIVFRYFSSYQCYNDVTQYKQSGIATISNRSASRRCRSIRAL